MDSYKLTAVADVLKVPVPGKAHTAEADAMLLWLVLRQAVQNAQRVVLPYEPILNILHNFFLFQLRNEIMELPDLPSDYSQEPVQPRKRGRKPTQESSNNQRNKKKGRN